MPDANRNAHYGHLADAIDTAARAEWERKHPGKHWAIDASSKDARRYLRRVARIITTAAPQIIDAGQQTADAAPVSDVITEGAAASARHVETSAGGVASCSCGWGRFVLFGTPDRMDTTHRLFREHHTREVLAAAVPDAETFARALWAHEYPHEPWPNEDDPDSTRYRAQYLARGAAMVAVLFPTTTKERTHG